LLPDQASGANLLMAALVARDQASSGALLALVIAEAANRLPTSQP
jgi:hypothetical protein